MKYLKIDSGEACHVCSVQRVSLQNAHCQRWVKENDVENVSDNDKENVETRITPSSTRAPTSTDPCDEVKEYVQKGKYRTPRRCFAFCDPDNR